MRRASVAKLFTPRVITVLSALIVTGAPPATHATNRYYLDQTSDAPAGRYRLNAISPDNVRTPEKSKRPPAFQKNFLYTLTDRSAGRVVWTFQGGGQQDSPRELYVHDSGAVVVWAAFDDLLVFSADGAGRCVRLSLRDCLPMNDRRFVEDTTAGPIWSQWSTWRFVTFKNQLLFYVRAWWGQQIVVDVNRGQFVPADDKELSDALRQSDRDETLRALRAAVDELKSGRAKDDDDWPATAAMLAGQLGLDESVELLATLERADAFTSSATVGIPGSERVSVGVDTTQWRTNPFRQVVQLSLRRLKRSPQCLSATRFMMNRAGKSEPFVVEPMPDRGRRLAQLRTGMEPIDVLRLIGSPDFIRSGPGEWQYDIDDEHEPLTLQLLWNGGRLKGVEQLKPPLWSRENVREQTLRW